MTATPRQRRRAADPRARGAELRALAEEPELWPILAANPAAYPDLLDYLRATGPWTGSAAQIQNKVAGLVHLVAGTPEYQFV